ncbi:gluconolactonase, partial [Tremellales sp. Uapishka_1]
MNSLQSKLDPTFCCCAIPLVNAGIYALLGEQFIISLAVGVLAVGTPDVVGSSIPSFTKYILAVVCFLVAICQPVGFIGVFREKTTLFKSYAIVNALIVTAAFSVAAALIIVSAVKHDTAVTACEASYFSNSTANATAETSSLSSEGQALCDAFAWADVGIMGGLWCILFLVQSYFLYITKTYRVSQVSDHKLYHSVYSENPEAFTMSILRSSRYNPGSVYHANAATAEAFDTRPSMDSQRDGYQGQGYGDKPDEERYEDAYHDGSRAYPNTNEYEYEQQQPHSGGYPFAQQGGGYIDHPPEPVYMHHEQQTPVMNDYRPGQSTGYSADGGLRRPEESQNHPDMFSLLFLTAISGLNLAHAWTPPPQAQEIFPSTFAVLDTVPPPSEFNGTSVFYPPGTNQTSLKARPFLILDNEFYAIIGDNPTLTLIADTSPDPLFHEAVVWYPPTDEVFFVQNSGAPAAGTGLNKSGIIEKISLSEAAAVSNLRNATGKVKVTTVNSSPQIINPNGATNFRGQLVYTGEGMGDNVPPALSLLNPVAPYNSTGRLNQHPLGIPDATPVILNNFFGRQFNSMNDVAINKRFAEYIYFTDVTYGYLQDFRPLPGIRNQVWQFNYDTGLVSAVADGFNLPNGLTFSPDGMYAYVTDTGINQGFFGYNFTYSANIYRYDVANDGTFGNRVTFAYVSVGIADGKSTLDMIATSVLIPISGIHCDDQGNVYAGCGDGVNVWNPSGKLIGKIFLGTTSANFQFAGQGRMVICAETQLYYATLGATGANITGL